MLLASNDEMFAVSEKVFFLESNTSHSNYLSNFYHRYFYTLNQVTF